jgi:hypothetical protein
MKVQDGEPIGSTRNDQPDSNESASLLTRPAPRVLFSAQNRWPTTQKGREFALSTVTTWNNCSNASRADAGFFAEGGVASSRLTMAT